MVTHSYYESDNRIIRYAEALAERGDEVEVLALAREPGQARQEILHGVRLHRIQDRFGKTEGSSWSYLWPLLRFLVASGRWLIANQRSRRFDLVHVHNIPDFLVFAAWPSKRRGARVILDIHDIVPEFFASKFGAAGRPLMGRALRAMERASAAMADHVILANHLWIDTYTARSAPIEKCSVVINHVDDAIFRPLGHRCRNDAPVLLFPGGLQWHQGVDIAIRAFALLHRKVPGARFHIYGDGSAKPQLVDLVRQLGLGREVLFFDPLPLRSIAKVMADADLAIVPKRADSFGNEAYSTKIMEFMSLGVPLVVSATRVDRHYFDDSVVRFFESGNHEALADAMLDVLGNATARERMVAQASEYARRHRWSRFKPDYLRLVDSLIAAA